jgi:hypothetical protein
MPRRKQRGPGRHSPDPDEIASGNTGTPEGTSGVAS